MRNKILNTFIFICFCFSLHSQSEDLTQDKTFFQSQEKIYQKWLDNSGLGKTLKVNTTWVKPDELILYLEFPFSDTDSVTNAWTNLKADFEHKSSLTLEEELFYKMVSIMEVRQSMANVQLYDTYDTRIEYCFKREIHFVDSEVKIEEEGCKAKIVDIDFDAADFTKMRVGASTTVTKNGMSAEDIRRQYPRERVFDAIFSYAKGRYEKNICEQRYPKVTKLDSKNKLRFKVTDLCREVIKEDNPNICEILRWFGYDCNWIKRERLIFTFTYNETENGFSVNCILDGAYGSGYYSNVRRGGYINMEVDFDEELQDYADEFKEKIREILSTL